MPEVNPDRTLDRHERLLGLFAHPDDELFCVGGTFAQAGADGANTRVVSFTQGEQGQIRNAETATRRTLGSVRVAELDLACTSLGVSSNACLDFGDGRLRDLDPEVLVAAAVREIRTFRPDVVYSFDHTGAYGHSDHIVMSEVSVLAAAAAADPNYAADGSPPHEVDRVLHAVFPKSDQLLIDLIVEWLIELPERFRGSHEFMNGLLMFADGSTMLGYAADKLRVEWFPKGSYVIEQGMADRNLYLVLGGSVDIAQESEDGTMRRLATVTSGEFIGETAIAEDGQRNAHCIASENTTCFVMAHDAVDRGFRSESGDITPTAALRDGLSDLLVHDVSEFVDCKLAALAAHRSQYDLIPGLFPKAMMGALLGVEYFVEIWPAQG